MQNENSIESEIAQDQTDLFCGDFCTSCHHLVSEHDSNSGKCSGLDFGGCWKACLCKKVKKDLVLKEE